MEHFNVLIVGGGAAGMAAALAAAKNGASVLLCEQEQQLGGVLKRCIHHGFGRAYFGEDLTGPEYAARFIAALEGCGAAVRTGCSVLRLERDKSALLSSPAGLERVRFERCILATGCWERPLASLGLGGTRPAGIFTAGQAQQLVNEGGYDIGSRIVILGSGDVGQIMARRFTLCGKEVVAMVEIRHELGGLARNRKECLEAFHIPVILGATVDEVLGTGRISGVMIRHVASGQREYLACDTLVTSLGLIPERSLTRSLEENGTLPSWLSLCGNCDYIHEIVDSVSVQAELMGSTWKGNER